MFTRDRSLERYVRETLNLAGIPPRDLDDEQRARALAAPTEHPTLRGKALRLWIIDGIEPENGGDEGENVQNEPQMPVEPEPQPEPETDLEPPEPAPATYVAVPETSPQVQDESDEDQSEGEPENQADRVVSEVKYTGQANPEAEPEPQTEDADDAQAEPKSKRSTNVEIMERAKAAEAELPGLIAQYLRDRGSADALAPMRGHPFIQNGRIYIQLQGRGGVRKKDQVEILSGFRPYLRDLGHPLGDAQPKVIRMALNALGFERNPFPYLHPDQDPPKPTVASYFSMPVADFPIPLEGPERLGKREARRREKEAAEASQANPQPSPADTAARPDVPVVVSNPEAPESHSGGQDPYVEYGSE